MSNDNTALHDAAIITCNGGTLCGSDQSVLKTLNIYTSIRRPLYGDLTVSLPFDDSILYNLVGGSAIKISIANSETMASSNDVTINAIITSVRILGRVEETVASTSGSGRCDVTIQFVGGYNSIPYHLAVIQSTIITDKISSKDAIKKVCTTCEVPFNVKGTISTSDSMKWVVANKNLIQAVEHISNRSYISDSDAMISWFGEDMSVNVSSLSWLFNNPVGKLTYVPTSGGTYIFDKDLHFSNMIRTDGIGARSIVFSSNIVKKVGISSNAASVISTDKINPTSTLTNSGQLNVANFESDKLNYSSQSPGYVSPNTYQSYYKCKQVREAVMANLSKFMIVTTRISGQYSIGDAVTVRDADGKTLPKLAAGNYLICDKNYVMSNRMCIQTLILVKDSIPKTGTSISVDKAVVK